MPNVEDTNKAPVFEVITICMNAIGERRYREALTSLDEGIGRQLEFPGEVVAEQLLERLRTLIAYLDFRLGEDFGQSWETEHAKQDRIEVRCSFCGKEKPQVNEIIAGPKVFICDKCIRTCADALDK